MLRKKKYSNNPYEILGVPENATEKEIQSAYYKLTQELISNFNPDYDEETRKKLFEAFTAYERLQHQTAERKKNPYDHNFYEILGIDNNATQQEIQHAYHKRMLQYHPDINKKPEAQTMTGAINVAYRTLRNPLKRAEYDKEKEKIQLKVKEIKQKASKKWTLELNISEREMIESIGNFLKIDKMTKDLLTKAEEKWGAQKPPHIEIIIENFSQEDNNVLLELNKTKNLLNNLRNKEQQLLLMNTPKTMQEMQEWENEYEKTYTQIGEKGLTSLNLTHNIITVHTEVHKKFQNKLRQELNEVVEENVPQKIPLQTHEHLLKFLGFEFKSDKDLRSEQEKENWLTKIYNMFR
jgi:curved DNA-binding protein CbpA